MTLTVKTAWNTVVQKTRCLTEGNKTVSPIAWYSLVWTELGKIQLCQPSWDQWGVTIMMQLHTQPSTPLTCQVRFPLGLPRSFHLGDLNLQYLARTQWYASGKKLKHSQVIWITEEGAGPLSLNFTIKDERRHDQFPQIYQEEGDGKVQF